MTTTSNQTNLYSRISSFRYRDYDLEIGYLLLPSRDMAERLLKRLKSTKQPIIHPLQLEVSGKIDPHWINNIDYSLCIYSIVQKIRNIKIYLHLLSFQILR